MTQFERLDYLISELIAERGENISVPRETEDKKTASALAYEYTYAAAHKRGMS